MQPVLRTLELTWDEAFVLSVLHATYWMLQPRKSSPVPYRITRVNTRADKPRYVGNLLIFLSWAGTFLGVAIALQRRGVKMTEDEAGE